MNGKGVGSGPKSSHPTALTQGGGEGRVDGEETSGSKPVINALELYGCVNGNNPNQVL